MLVDRIWSDDFVVFDVETTGLDPLTDRIVQFAAIRFVGGDEVDGFDSFINPGVELPEGINAVTPADLVGAPPFAEVAGRILAILGGRAHPMAYNAPFDVAFIDREFDRIDAPEHPTYIQRVIDPLVWVRHVDRYVKGKGRHKLTTTAERWGVDVGGRAHDARTDCRLAAGLAFAMIHSVPGDVVELMKWQGAARVDQDREFEEWKARQGN